jgi:hypothetical protein
MRGSLVNDRLPHLRPARGMAGLTSPSARSRSHRGVPHVTVDSIEDTVPEPLPPGWPEAKLSSVGSDRRIDPAPSPEADADHMR